MEESVRIRHYRSPMRIRTRPAIATVSGLWLVGAVAACSPGTTDGASAGAGPTSTVPYKDGTYSATGTYQSPGGTETVAVDLTLASDLVTAVTVTPQATRPDSAMYQKAFAAGIADVVVGKDIDTLNVSKVAGSSLTSGGFNDALAQIKAKAGG